MIRLDLSDYISLAGVLLGCLCVALPAVIAGVEFLVSKRSTKPKQKETVK